ncbi:MAG: DNA-3-methyladenine glycosylase [Bacteroidales bacterium]|nr:DNA-3-methyladenine glycosylase [Bacteroidales bacterium]MCB8999827.1 DNA-3-methyladenine glycosylase [Bacteroidales bacterium]
MPVLDKEFFSADVLTIAPLLPGKSLVRIIDNKRFEWMITEVEAYRGTEDLACHASKGRTKRTEIMYHEGGHIYMYLIYGVYWMLNIVCGEKDNPQAVLIRGISGVNGPGRVGRKLKLDGSFYGEKVYDSRRIWIEDAPLPEIVLSSPRIGIDYSGEPWSRMPWRYYIKE